MRLLRGTSDGLSAASVRVDAEARVEAALISTPDSCDTRIARICGTNVFVVREVRDRLGTYPTRPA